jgi:hypothetical protein
LLFGRSCRELLEGRAHSRSLGYARDDKVEGGGPPWHEWRWMDRVEKKANLDKSDSQPSLPGLFLAGMETQDCVLGYSQPSPSTSSHGTPGQAGQALRDWVGQADVRKNVPQGLKSIVFATFTARLKSLRKTLQRAGKEHLRG